MEPSDRPAKRPRLKGPDGFHVTKSRSKPTCKPPPSFVSSFSSPKPGYLDSKPDESKSIAHHARSRQECPRNPSSKLPDTSDVPLCHESKGKKKASSDRPADHHERPSEPSSSANDAESEKLHVPAVKRPGISNLSSTSTHPPALPRQKPLSAPLRTLKPPSLVVSTPAKALPSAKPLSFSILKPPLLPQPPIKVVVLKPVVPPTIEPSFLKKPSTNMKAISSFATDPTKDGAGAELLSLFLQQHRHSFVSPFECEMQRGIGLSPRKNKSAKDKGKFRRGGLADRAQHLISCSKTDHTLWHRQLEQALSSSLSLPSYDMRFRILRVLPLPAKVPTPTGVHLAVCRISSRHKLVGVLGELTDQCYVILFPHFTGPNREFEEGRDVLAWKPWFRAALTSVVPREILEALSVEPLMPPMSVIMAPRWHVMRAS